MFELMNIYHVLWWVALGLAALIVEMLTGTLLFLWLAGAIFITSLIVWIFNPSFSVEVVIFAITAMISMIFWQLRYTKTQHNIVDHGLNNPMAHLVGRELILDEPIIKGVGRIRVNDGQWNATCQIDLASGTRVRVVRIESLVLVLQPL